VCAGVYRSVSAAKIEERDATYGVVSVLGTVGVAVYDLRYGKGQKKTLSKERAW
jgi:hypothetical protein